MLIYLDMDGVLMDFEAHKHKHIEPHVGREYHHLPKAEWTDLEREHDARLHKVMALDDFWTTMEPMPDAHLLWAWCSGLGHHVLTATPANAAYRDRCAREKLQSIHRWFDPTFPAYRFNACLRSEKKLLAVPGHILVDDMRANCEEWTAAGGTAILHKNAVSSIQQLREICGHV